jgi:hypothetical protein
MASSAARRCRTAPAQAAEPRNDALRVSRLANSTGPALYQLNARVPLVTATAHSSAAVVIAVPLCPAMMFGSPSNSRRSTRKREGSAMGH